MTSLIDSEAQASLRRQQQTNRLPLILLPDELFLNIASNLSVLDLCHLRLADHCCNVIGNRQLSLKPELVQYVNLRIVLDSPRGLALLKAMTRSSLRKHVPSLVILSAKIHTTDQQSRYDLNSRGQEHSASYGTRISLQMSEASGSSQDYFHKSRSSLKRWRKMAHRMRRCIAGYVSTGRCFGLTW